MMFLISVEELYKICGFQSERELCIDLETKIKEYCSLIKFDAKYIDNIFISSHKYFGEVKITSYIPIRYNIYLDTSVVFFLYQAAKNSLAKSVIFHELYHCKEMTTTNDIIDLKNINHDSKNLQELYVNLGNHQWSEYYAHFNSCVICPSDHKTIDNFLDLSNNLKNFRKEILFKDSTEHFQLYKNCIYSYICNAIILIANNNRLHNIESQQNIDSFKEIDLSTEKYFNTLTALFEEYYTKYPLWVSINAFKDLGKALLNV